MIVPDESLSHLRQNSLHTLENAGQVELKYQLPIYQASSLYSIGVSHARIINQNINRTKIIGDRRNL